MLILGCDPGHHKCGIALLADNGTLIKKTIVKRSELIAEIRRMIHEHHPATLLVGSGTTGLRLVTELKEIGFEPVLVDERGTTLEAQHLWDKDYSETGWFGFLPRFVRVLFTPTYLDDWAAVALVHRWLRKGSANDAPPCPERGDEDPPQGRNHRSNRVPKVE